MEELFQTVRHQDKRELFRELRKQWEQAGEGTPSQDLDRRFRLLMDRLREPGSATGVQEVLPRWKRIRNRRRQQAAAVCLFLLLGGAAIILKRPTAKKPVEAAVKHNDVKPGGNKARLTLADGSSIILDSAGNGTLSQQGTSRVIKLTNGRLAYRLSRGGVDTAPVFNTISTPRGGQYELELPDGTKVWLDAGSSLRFPTAFPGNSRAVQLTGEAYFEVAPHPHQPFVISVFSRVPGQGDTLQNIKVLGTAFNVMAYADEPLLKTTLVDGAVRIDNHLLKPGEQAQWGHASGVQVVTDADVEAAVAWKNGYFNFNKADIQTVMRQLSRWYDVEVSFRGDAMSDKIFFGGIQRNLPLSSVFSILERSGVKFTIDGRKVVVDL